MRAHSRTPEIIRLWKAHFPRAEIAKQLKCSKSNVTQAIKRHLAWDNRIATLTDEHHAWLVRQATKSSTPPSVMARAMLTDAIDEAMQKEQAG